MAPINVAVGKTKPQTVKPLINRVLKQYYCLCCLTKTDIELANVGLAHKQSMNHITSLVPRPSFPLPVVRKSRATESWAVPGNKVTISPCKRAGLGVIQSHPLHRICFGQYHQL